MRKLFGTCGMLLSLACASHAQTTPESAKVLGAQVAQVTTPGSCAVGFAVARIPPGTLRPAADVNAHPGRGMALDLSLAPLQRSAIRSVSITVYGLLGPTVLPVSQRAGKGSEDMTLALWSNYDGRTHSKAYPARITGVQEVELHEIIFADGTAWHEPATGACRVAPNGFLLVASGQ